MNDWMIKRFLTRILALLSLAALMAGAIIPAFADDLVMMGFDDASLNRDWANNRFFSHMAEKTGLTFTFRQYSDEQAYHDALMAMATSQDNPDVLFKASLSPAQALMLTEQGVLMDLAPLLKEHCPNMIRTLPTLQYDQHKIEDVDTDGEDHLYDTLRYHLEQHVIKPMESKPEYKPKGDPLDMFTRY